MTPIIDSHLHVWSDDVERFPRQEVPYPGSAELLLEYMDEAGVDQSVIVLSMHYQYDNRVLAETLKQYPDRFAGVGVVDPRGPAAAEALTRLVEQHGIGGVRLRGTIEDEWFCRDDTAPLWERAAALNVPLCLLAQPHQMGHIRRMVERFPQTPVVIDHFAMIPASAGVNSEVFQTFLELAQFPKVYIKLSGLYYWGGHYPYPDAQAPLKAALAGFGAERVLWGSDWPHVLFGGGYIRCLNFVRRELTWLSAAQKEQILGRTAQRLWWGK